MEPTQPDNLREYTAFVLETASYAGRILLENGAEIFRVEETIERIAQYYGVDHGDVYVLSNGIFISGNRKLDQAYSQIRHIPTLSTRMDRIIAVNQLSREIEQGRYTVEEARARLGEIARQPFGGPWLQVLACGIGCGCFSVMFGGSPLDGAAALISGAVMQLSMLFIGSRMTKLVGNMFGAAVGTLMCILCKLIGLGNTLSLMVIGTMMTLIPGVPFTNGIRDIADGDYLSGIVRMMDALLAFAGIAVGMAAMILLYHSLLGGVLS